MVDQDSKRQFYKGTKQNIFRIFKVLKSSSESGEDFVTVSQIAKRSGLHKWTVSRVLDIHMQPFVEIIQPEELEAVGLQIKMVKLRRPDTTIEQLLKYLKLRESLVP